jgi:hypothetical protein
MKILALVAAMCAATATQSADAAMAGTWTAQFEGRTFVRLQLASVNGTVTGGISLGNFELDKAGAVRRASPPPPDLKPISEVAQRASIMTFTVAGSDDPDRFEFKLIDTGRAELRLLLSDEDREELAAEGIPPPRPIPLTKR